jgi:microcystin degradation protein MlrC
VPGDSTIILREMLRRKVQNAALATIWDPIAVRTCFSAGEGAQLKLRFGGKMSEFGGDPVDADIIVRRAKRNAVQSFGKSVVPLGDSVWIEIQGIDLILNSVRSQAFSPDIFSNLGIDPGSKDLLIVKSTNHFHDAFSRIASEILYVAVDGPYPNNPVTTDYKRLKRNIWPREEFPHGK